MIYAGLAAAPVWNWRGGNGARTITLFGTLQRQCAL